MGKSDRHFTAKREIKNIVLLEGSQASPSCPFDKSRVEVKTLEWLEAVAAEF
jgi:hypothetical protein